MRLTQLDSLRGVAALVVVVHHVLLTVPVFAEPYRSERPEVDGSAWWFVYTPLHLLWDGKAAVAIFFVLSGFVLVLPFARRRPDWPTYYPRRLARLYLPTWAAVVFSLILNLVFVRQEVGSWWVAQHQYNATSLLGIGGASTLVIATGWLNSALWSLKWEVWFSLLLPLYLIVVRACGRWWPLLWPAALIASQVGLTTDITALHYLPEFMIGVAAGLHRETVERWTSRVSPAGWIACLVVALLAINAPWYPVPVPFSLTWMQAGCALLVLTVWRSGLVARALNTAPLLWLGQVSFSLYLVHEPIVVSVAQVTGDMWQTLGCSLVLSLLAGWAFYTWIEKPAHGLSRSVGDWSADRIAARRRSATAGAEASRR